MVVPSSVTGGHDHQSVLLNTWEILAAMNQNVTHVTHISQGKKSDSARIDFSSNIISYVIAGGLHGRQFDHMVKKKSQQKENHCSMLLTTAPRIYSYWSGTGQLEKYKGKWDILEILGA